MSDDWIIQVDHLPLDKIMSMEDTAFRRSLTRLIEENESEDFYKGGDPVSAFTNRM